MKKLLSLPPNLVECFYDLEKKTQDEWFCSSDPVESKLGSGGGTAWLLDECRKRMDPALNFHEWIGNEKRILLHAGGQSRRLPSYAPSGKVLTPIPVFRWEKGQRLGQNLLELQLPLYEKIMAKAPETFHTLIASGDVYIRAGKALQDIPAVDVVCYGLWVDPELAKNHGVFVLDRKYPETLDFMLQKPSVDKLAELARTHLFLMDVGIWLLSDRAVDLLVKNSVNEKGEVGYYDLYSDFGTALGEHPLTESEEINKLTVAILPLPGGEFYHYGTSRELIASTLAVQNLVNDQRMIIQTRVKPHPAIFVQNAVVDYKLTAANAEVWIENSCVGAGWELAGRHVITGVPLNKWKLKVPEGVCVDIIPIGRCGYVVRPYGFADAFKGALEEDGTLFMGKPAKEWFEARGLVLSDREGNTDIQSARLFPVCENIEDVGFALRWMISESELDAGKKIWQNCDRISADEISAEANLVRLFRQRESFRAENWVTLARNYEKSVFYQLDLNDAAEEFIKYNIGIPSFLPDEVPMMTRIRDCMFRARVNQLSGMPFQKEEEQAFALLRDGLANSVLEKKQYPRIDVFADQIVWGRSPVRIDLAGGWTDTPPYCLNEGGNVVNIAIELNGQPPLQVYVKPCKEKKVVLRSIDLGAVEEVNSFEELRNFTKIGSPFSIPKAALALAGFIPEFCSESYVSLKSQLDSLGCGIEISLLAAIPAGSGLGTSSILSATVLGAVSDFCGLAWDKHEICRRTLVLEQLLTTGGGWQDQYGGVLHGVKLLQTTMGFEQSPFVKWLPDFLFTDPEYQSCHLLYYTGITRTAKNILSEIVRGMFLNSAGRLTLLADMKQHALDLYEAIQRGNFTDTGKLIGKTWDQNKRLDSGTNPPEIENIIRRIQDYTLGCKLPGAGGGGYLYMVAKDPEAAACIRRELIGNPANDCARFVEMSLSQKGLQTSRS